MTAAITEDSIEQVVISELQEIGYTCLQGGDISPGGLAPEREYNEVALKAGL